MHYKSKGKKFTIDTLEPNANEFKYQITKNERYIKVKFSVITCDFECIQPVAMASLLFHVIHDI